MNRQSRCIKMTRLILKYWYLLRCMGVGWLVRRILYRFKLKSGWFKRRFPCVSWEDRGFSSYLLDQVPADPARYLEFRRDSAPIFLFDPSRREVSREGLLRFDTQSKEDRSGNCIIEADSILTGIFRFFSHHDIKTGFPPDWFLNHFQEDSSYPPEDRKQHWSEIDDFSGGDIKAVWELSRFGFVFSLVRAYWRTGDEKYAEGFWKIVEDWRKYNPPQTGPHWKCGQEIAFRIMAWIFGLYGFIGAKATTPDRVVELSRMIAVSAERIESNISYALSQKNNHPISEALGLWTVGVIFPEFSAAARWKDRGRKILEKCALELIYPDGTFSQHSSNYHRLMLHDYLWVLSLADKNGETFSEALMERVRAAGCFLGGVIDPTTGRVPNLGANDGALILPLTNCDYLDYRPVTQAIQVLLTGERVFPPGPWDEALYCMGLMAPEYTGTVEEVLGGSSYFKNGGYLILRGNHSRGVIRCTPEYRHRPSHADQLHLDLWRGDVNILRDSGTYSYNSPPDDSYFSSTAAHNTVEFDGRDQMPRISRFLFGAWLGVWRTEPLIGSVGRISWAGAYRDWRGCSHERRVELDPTTDTWTITDRVSGYNNKAILRWRLAPELNWELKGDYCVAEGVSIRIDIRDNAGWIKLVQGWEALYYFEKATIPVLEITLMPPRATVISTISFLYNRNYVN